MASITELNITNVFFDDERVSYNKMNSVVRDSLSTISSNHILIANEMNTLLRGVEGGSDQAVLPFFMENSPDGWTRDVTTQSGSIMRVTDGVTVPSGDAPTEVGGENGGAWTIGGVTFLSSGNHSHNINTHTHTLSGHIHTIGAHTHTLGNHTHTIPTHTHTISSNSFSTGIGGQTVSSYGRKSPGTGSTINEGHTHSVSSHGHSGSVNSVGSTTYSISANVTSGSSPTVGSPVSDITGASSETTTSANGDHTHSTTADGVWRPKYFNVIICSRD